MKHKVLVFLILLFVFNIKAYSAEVSGDLTDNVTWKANDGPFIINSNFSILEGVTLNIEPGVIVKIAEEVSIFVKGEMTARGSASDKIVFTALNYDEENDNGRWGSIIFTESSTDAVYKNIDEYVSGSILEQCTFEYATQAVQVEASAPFIKNSLFQYNLIVASTYVAGGAGVYVGQNGSPRILGCTFKENETTLMYGGAICSNWSEPVIYNNTFISNKAVYGGAVATIGMASPIVGNTFDKNETNTEGGAISLISTTSSLFNNTIVNNIAGNDGGGVHVCVTCYPHSSPIFMDNIIKDNKNSSEGAAGVGAGYLRGFKYNSIYNNYTGEVLSNFTWFNEMKEDYSDWVINPDLSFNYWGTDDSSTISDSIHDGNDEEGIGITNFEPFLLEPIEKPEVRVSITTRKLRYNEIDEKMPVFLTIYNPGEEIELELLILLKYPNGISFYYTLPLDLPNVEMIQGVYKFKMPKNNVYFTKLLEPDYKHVDDLESGEWVAVIFNADSGNKIGDISSARFVLGLKDKQDEGEE